MTAIAHAALESSDDVSSTWRRVAAHVLEWLRIHAVEPRDAIVLVPFAALLPVARAAFAGAGGWMPRVETTVTLAAALGPAAVAGPGQLSFDATLDRLSVAQLLRATGWGEQWARRDARAFEQAVGAVVETAQAFARAAAQCPPAHRPGRWQRWREQLAPLGGPGARQRALAQLALEWASQAPPPDTDRLFGCRPAAWVVIDAGGADPLAHALLQFQCETAGSPALSIDLDPPVALRFDPGSSPAWALCNDLEDEAQCTAAQVIAHLRQGQVPIALISQDRLLVRRVRALLERQQVALHDETGWTLSTTRAAAQVMSLLKAARGGASTDAVLDWLKSGTRWSTPADGALSAFEAVCRRQQRVRADNLDVQAFEGPARQLWEEASALLAALHATGRLPLTAWLRRGVAALQASGAWPRLQEDEAGQQVLAQLYLDRVVQGASGADAARWAATWGARLDAAAFTYAEFVDWVDGTLERATFQPGRSVARRADVIITPLARAMLRPFAAVVCPGADARRLGAAVTPHPLLPDAVLGELGLPNAAQRRADETSAFAQLLRLPALTLLRRRHDGDEPLADSPLVERLRLALARRGEALRPWVDPRGKATIDALPASRGAAVAPALLPSTLSASACEALRACPYRFFTLYVLRARESDELEEEVAKRDYGNWLHAVLHAFHRERPAVTSEAEDIASLQRLAQAQRVAQGLGEADFEPFAASFAAFVPRYLAWQRARDAAGLRWRDGEQRAEMELAGVEAIALEGVIDRIDAGPGARLQLIDYKTGSVSGLKEKVREPLEDTQLAFYAALMRAREATPPAALRATYLALDARKIEEIEHKQVETSAALLVEGLTSELRRLREGVPMKPLGEAATCDFCEARGVCRRDHWSVPADTVDDVR